MSHFTLDLLQMLLVLFNRANPSLSYPSIDMNQEYVNLAM